MPQDWRPDLSNVQVQMNLRPRASPYFNIIRYCRHIGLEVHFAKTSYWVARVRLLNGRYKQFRLAPAWLQGNQSLQYVDAVAKAEEWFLDPNIKTKSATSYPIGSKRTLSICPIGPTHSIGHALSNYLEWKEIAATKSHFETLVSLVNYHLVPRLSSIAVAEFNARHFHDFAVSVLETPAKTGRLDPIERVSIQELSDESLRKRKKTLNTLVSILRGTFELAKDRGELTSDLPIRSLRRVPNADRPRAVFLNRTECGALLAACDCDLRNLVLAALYTGCRANELIQMRASDYLANESALYVAHPKGRRNRYVFLPPAALVFFDEMAKQKDRDEWLLTKQNQRAWGGEYKYRFRQARKKAGLDDQVTFHGLRHTYASQLLEGGASLMTVAEQLGHACIQTVYQTYGHMTAEHRAGEVRKFFDPMRLVLDDVPHEMTPPVFRHMQSTSWPIANHSRCSGELLKKIVLAT